MDNYNYPLGADTSMAPWNQKEQKPVEVEVTIVQTLSKTVKVLVDDYEELEDGSIDTSNCNFGKAVEDQIWTPSEVMEKPFEYKSFMGETKGWCLDDFEIIEE